MQVLHSDFLEFKYFLLFLNIMVSLEEREYKIKIKARLNGPVNKFHILRLLDVECHIEYTLDAGVGDEDEYEYVKNGLVLVLGMDDQFVQEVVRVSLILVLILLLIDLAIF